MLCANKHSNNHLQNAYNKGDKFVFEVIEFCSVDDLNDRESVWIEFFNSTNRQFGYNFDAGGNANKQRHPETILKSKLALKKYFSNKQNRINLSETNTSIPMSVVKKIKELLRHTDDECTVIAKRLGVSENIVTHICNINSHTHILEEYNEYLRNRNENIQKKINRNIIKMYRDGCTYKEISEVIGIHERNVIRRVNKNKTIHDDRCRLNCMNRAILKRDSLIRTLRSMGKNTVEISNIIKGN